MFWYKINQFEIHVGFKHNTTIKSGKVNGSTFCDISVDGTRVATGMSVCGKEDNFNRKDGRDISFKRATESFFNLYEISKENRRNIWKEYSKKKQKEKLDC